MMRYFFLIFTLIQAFESFSQNSQMPRFGMPMEVPLIVTAGYGEIRPDHFHSGIDFSTYGKSLPVTNIDDGYVSRIRVSAFGYGNALYINHPSGFTSVYAHLAKFSPELNAYVKNLQETAREYEVDAFPDSMQFTFKRNDIIGMTGNSGSSSAPHLHFEIRDQFFENTLNPLLFGYAERDITPPNMTSLSIIPKKGEGKVNNLENLISLPL
jgi:murein DD-endopeptidase MepM/ murein hydrolase activator NlpD